MAGFPAISYQLSMYFRAAADAILLLHAAFIAFVMLGALLAWRRPRIMLAHLPAVAWALYVEVSGSRCPLTALENLLLFQAGQQGYAVGFVEHYCLAAIYPPGLTQGMQLALGGLVGLVNIAAYCAILRRRRKRIRIQS